MRQSEYSRFHDHMQAATDWLATHNRAVTIGAVAVAVMGAGAWLYARSEAMKEERAASSLMAAEQSIAAGNAALAQSDLEKLVTRYRGTAAAHQATLQLVHLLYDKGQFQQGITELERLLEETGDRDLKSVAEDQIATAYEDMGKFGEAAERYKRAAALARFAADSANHMASAARAHVAAGNVAEARRIWSDLAADPTGPVAAEARVRLGELSVQPARGGA